ncbi:MAG TPA: hypothetical protein P5228_06560 [Bacteroidales bacterium]|nr:hypothetical protein [Bacteroidales bacterium]HRZ49890.1 hypothetical protein [Bacteroidales bacterium]
MKRLYWIIVTPLFILGCVSKPDSTNHSLSYVNQLDSVNKSNAISNENEIKMYEKVNEDTFAITNRYFSLFCLDSSVDYLLMNLKKICSNVELDTIIDPNSSEEWPTNDIIRCSASYKPDCAFYLQWYAESKLPFNMFTESTCFSSFGVQVGMTIQELNNLNIAFEVVPMDYEFPEEVLISLKSNRKIIYEIKLNLEDRLKLQNSEILVNNYNIANFINTRKSKVSKIYNTL